MESPKRRSFSRSPSSLLSIAWLSRKSSSTYTKLPQEPLKLSVLKLDGSCFDIEVRKAASVAELKEAVEAAFSEVLIEESDQISWPHLWEQFCLCFEDQKLVAEIGSIRDFGIKDGDQLHFIRHHSPAYRMVKRRSRKRVSPSKQQKRSSPRGPINGDRDEYEKEDEEYEDIEWNGHQYFHIKNEKITQHRKSKLKHFLRGWFWGSKRRVRTTRSMVPKTKGEVKVRPTRFPFCFWRKFGKTVRF